VRQIFEAIGGSRREEGRDDLPGRAERLPCLRLADRGYVLVNGRVRLSGTGRELLANQEVRAAYLEGGHAMSPSTCFMFDWFGDTLAMVLLFNLVLVGPASFAPGRACA
jgi:hypothetical protein